MTVSAQTRTKTAQGGTITYSVAVTT